VWTDTIRSTVALAVGEGSIAGSFVYRVLAE
jgi:hypothetical protein